MSPIYWGLIIIGLLCAYCGLSYTRSKVIRSTYRIVLMGRGAVLTGWVLFAVSMAGVGLGALGVLGMPVLTMLV